MNVKKKRFDLAYLVGYCQQYCTLEWGKRVIKTHAAACRCIIAVPINKAASDYTNTFSQIEICDYKYLEATF